MRNTVANSELRAFAMMWFEGRKSEMRKVAYSEPFNATKLCNEIKRLEKDMEAGGHNAGCLLDKLASFSWDEMRQEQALQRLAGAARSCMDNGVPLAEAVYNVKAVWED